MLSTTDRATHLTALRAALESGALTEGTAARLVAAMSDHTFRDVVLAELVGQPQTADELAAGARPACPWLLDGPLRREALQRGLLALDALERVTGGGGPYADAPATIRAYIEWALGRPSTAAQRLRAVSPDYRLARTLRRAIALGVQGPEVTDA